MKAYRMYLNALPLLACFCIHPKQRNVQLKREVVRIVSRSKVYHRHVHSPWCRPGQEDYVIARLSKKIEALERNCHNVIEQANLRDPGRLHRYISEKQ
jgi:hypothetical protein